MMLFEKRVTMKKTGTLLLAALLLTACGDSSEISVPQEMQYIKTSVLYDTITDMYQNPDRYVGGIYHMVGTLYPSVDDSGETFYSVYAPDADGDHGIGLELDWPDFSGFTDFETVTVEGRLEVAEAQQTVSGADHPEKVQYLILRTTRLEKRNS